MSNFRFKKLILPTRLTLTVRAICILFLLFVPILAISLRAQTVVGNLSVSGREQRFQPVDCPGTRICYSYDAGTVTISAGGVTATQSYGQSTLIGNILQGLIATINASSNASVTIDSSGVIYAKAAGANPSSFQFSSSSTYDSSDFKQPSFTATFTPPPIQGYVDPKYVVVGVTYAPPGPSSFVQYTSGQTLATTKSTSNSFSSGKTVSVSVSNGTGIEGWASGHVTISNSNTVTQASSSSSSITLSLASQLAIKTPGTPSAYSPVNHDYDIVWLWLNPVALYTVIPSQPDTLIWNGYGYDTTDQPAMDIWPIYVGYLNGHLGALDPEDTRVLARSWASGQQWPAGQGPGLTSTDFQQILQADPFSNNSYSVILAPNVSPATTTDGRFTISGGSNFTAQSFDYRQALPGESSINQTLQNTYTTTSTLGQSSTTTTSETFGIDVSFTSTIFIDNLSEDLKYSQTLTWTDMSSTSDTSTATQIDQLSITGPPCATTASPCVPTYTGPPEFDVYQDNIYGTFMFNPVN